MQSFAADSFGWQVSFVSEVLLLLISGMTYYMLMETLNHTHSSAYISYSVKVLGWHRQYYMCAP